jgi:hypothetical protein
VIVLIAAQNLFDGRYVKSAVYERDREKDASSARAQESLISALDKSLALQGEVLKVVPDHESRIRTIEQEIYKARKAQAAAPIGRYDGDAGILNANLHPWLDIDWEKIVQN